MEHFNEYAQTDVPEFRISNAMKCSQCGWWAYCFTKRKEYPEQFTRDELYEGILYSFDTKHTERPINILRQQIHKKQIDLRSISPKELEILVGAVFRDFYHAPVRHIGGPGDGGIDILVTVEDSPIAIQVKRREKAKPNESVCVIRDLIGSVILAQLPRGIVVSTAEDFTKPAKKAVTSPGLTRVGVDIDLYNYKKLSEMIYSMAPGKKPWMSVPRIRSLHELWGIIE